jgi:hypothetical protein
MTTHTCALTGQTIATKAYIIKTTEGEEIVSPEALFHPDADVNLGLLIADLVERIGALEAALEAKESDGQEDGVDPAAAGNPQATAPPAKAPLPKRTPGQRKAAD